MSGGTVNTVESGVGERENTLFEYCCYSVCNVIKCVIMYDYNLNSNP